MSIQLKRSPTATLDVDYVLKEGQIGIEFRGDKYIPPYKTKQDSNYESYDYSSVPLIKVGDGVTRWYQLPPIAPDSCNFYVMPSMYEAANPDKRTPVIRGNLAQIYANNFHVHYLDSENKSHPILRLSTGGFEATSGTTTFYDSSITTSNQMWFRRRANSIGQGSRIELWGTNHSMGGIEFNGPSIVIDRYDDISATSNTDLHIRLNRVGVFSVESSDSYFKMQSDGFVGIRGTKNCGTADYPWSAVYASKGTIQSSSRSTKSDIRYLSEADTLNASADDTKTHTIGLEDVITFINSIEPATFAYLDSTETETTIESKLSISPESVQLGLIAEDLKELPIYNYIGITKTATRNPAETLNESDGQPVEVSGLQPIPLAVCALTACKYLLQRLEILEEQFSA